jgi:hypothetical protein
MAKGKVEIINVKLDINLDAEIQKQSNIDPTIKARADAIIEGVKARDKKPPTEKELKEVAQLERFQILYDLMLPKDGLEAPHIAKDEVIKTLNITQETLGATIGKFKKYLNIKMGNQWVMLIGKNIAKDRVYYLQSITAPEAPPQT